MKLIEDEFEHAVPCAHGSFTAAASSLALMIATVPVMTLRDLRRVTAPGGRIVTGCGRRSTRTVVRVPPRRHPVVVGRS